MGPRIVLVTDPAYGDEVIARCVRVVAGTLPAGWLCVQLRDKKRLRAGLRLFAWQLRAVTREAGAGLVVNGDAGVARDVGADGVHLGVDAGGAAGIGEARALCGPGAWISVAAHSDDDVRAAVSAGADAVLVSPVFSTRSPSLAAADPAAKVGRGPDSLRSAREIARGRVSVYALGGVTTARRARACLDAGADGVAVIRMLLGSDEPARAAQALHDAVALRC